MISSTGQRHQQPSYSHRRGQGGAGFTLLELILVMLIMCTLLAIAAPNLRGFFSSREGDDAAEQLVAVTKLARTMAISEGRIYRLNFNIMAGYYWLTVQDAGTYRMLGNEFGKVYWLPKDVILRWWPNGQTSSSGSETGSGLNPHIDFDAIGRTEPGIIQLTDRGGNIINIVCHTATERFVVWNSDENPFQAY